MTRDGQVFKNKVVARLLTPERAALLLVARDGDAGVGTLKCWYKEAQSRPARDRAWTAGSRLEAVSNSAAMDEATKSAWSREHGFYPAEFVKWRAVGAGALAEPE